MPASTTPLATQVVWVFLAGGLGATLRVTLAAWIDGRWAERVPFVGTLAVNMLGCFAIGVAATLIPAGTARTAVVGGLLGGFTTYSAFALFSHELLREAELGTLALQVAGHLVIGVLCVAGGVALARALGGTA